MAPAAVPVGMMAASLGANVLSGLFQGYMQGKISQEQLKAAMAQLAQQGGLTQEALGQQGIGQANSLVRQQGMLPMRDQASYMLQQRMGMSPQAFKPDNFQTSQPGQQGGIDLGKMQQAAGAYKPGMGGQMDQGGYIQDFLKQLGYKGPGQGYGQPQVAPIGNYSGSQSFQQQPGGGQDKAHQDLLDALRNKGQGFSGNSNPGWPSY